MRKLTRRDFLKYAGIGAVGLVAKPGLALSGLGEGLAGSDASDVVQCFDFNATSGTSINEAVVQVMVDESVKRLTGQTTVGEAWKSFFPGITASSVVSIKVNCINRYLPTHPQFVNCIVNGLVQMDLGGTNFERNRVIIWDRTDGELTSSGFTIYEGSEPDRVRCFGSDHSGVGYDTGNPLNVNGVTSNPSKILSQMSEYVINAAVLKNHSQGVVTLGMKNHYGSVHNPGSLQHSSGCSPAIPCLNQQIRDVLVPNGRQKVFIIDGLFGIYSGGPGGQPNFNPKLLIVSRDTVACDYQGQNVINIERQARGLGTLNAAHITTAAGPPYNLGTTDINLIEINNPTSVTETERVMPGNGELEVRPNPVRLAAVRRKAEIGFVLPVASPVEIDLLSTAGRVAASVYRGRLDAGKHRVDFSRNRRLAAGTYLLRLRHQGGTLTRRVTVLN